MDESGCWGMTFLIKILVRHHSRLKCHCVLSETIILSVTIVELLDTSNATSVTTYLFPARSKIRLTH